MVERLLAAPVNPPQYHGFNDYNNLILYKILDDLLAKDTKDIMFDSSFGYFCSFGNILSF